MKKFMAVMGAMALLALPAVLVTAPASVAADAPGTIGGPVVAAPVPTFDALDTVTAAWMTPSEMGHRHRQPPFSSGPWVWQV